MATQLLTVGLTNAVLASVLAIMAFGLLRWRWNAYLAAVLWLVVLLKFVTPPLLSYPIERPVADVSGRPSSGPFSRSTADANLEFNRQTLPDRTRVELSGPADPVTRHDEHASRSSAKSDAARLRSTPSSRSRMGDAAPVRSGFQGFAAVLWRPSVWALLWLAGSAATALWLTVNGWRFQRLIRHPQLAGEDDELTAALRRLCDRFGLRKTPRLRVVDARVSPLLWTWWNGATLVFPRSLVNSLTPTQREMLLTHELAHLLRRDHLSRWLEVAVQSLYWWVPLVPWIRRRLHAAQEECCDAFVHRHFPAGGVDYCDTLLAAARWLQGARPSPAWASELGSPSGLKHRIQLMLERRISQPIPRRATAACVLLGLAACVTSIRWVQAQQAPELTHSQDDRAAATVESPQETKVAATPTEFVITDEDAQPIPSGKVHLRGHFDNGDFFQADLSIHAGRAIMTFRRPRLAELNVSVKSPDFQTYTREYEVEGADRGFTVASRYSYQLKPGVTIGGTVVDVEGRPLERVRVYVSAHWEDRDDGGRDSGGDSLRTGADGKWSISGIPPDLSRLHLRFEHITHVYESSEPGRPYTQPARPDEYDGLLAQSNVRVMREAPPLVGTVVDPEGNPIGNVVVDISGRDPDWDQHLAPGLVIKTNAQGEFRVPRPPPGEQRLTLQHPEWMRETVPVTLPPTEPVRLVLHKGKRIEFRTVDTEGNPIEGMTFIPDLPGPRIYGKTDAEGRWVWENAPDRVLKYQIVRSGYLSQPPDSNYGPDDSPVTLTFRKSIPVIAAVVDADTGEPIREFRLYEGTHFKSNRPGTWSWHQQTSQSMRPVKGSWAEGVIDATPGTPIEPGRFIHELAALDRIIRFRIQADGYLPEVSEPLDAAALPDEPLRLEFRLEKNTGLQRTVLTPNGDFAANAQVATTIKRHHERSSLTITNGVPDESRQTGAAAIVRTDANGRFKLPVYNDPFACVITHETGYLQLSDQELAEQEQLTLQSWAALEGTVFVQGKPALGVEILAYHQRPSFSRRMEFPRINYLLSATTDESGKYRLAKAVAGSWELIVMYEPPDADEADESSGLRRAPWRSRRSSSLPVTLVAGEATRQDVGRDGVDVIGRVVVPDGVEIDWEFSGVHFVRYLPADMNGRRQSEFHQSRLDRDGTFRCFNIQPGEYDGAAIVGKPGDSIWFMHQAQRKRSFETELRLTPEMFVGKSVDESIDLGEIVLEPAGPR